MCVSYCCLLEDERGSNDDNVEKMHSPRERQKAGSVGLQHRCSPSQRVQQPLACAVGCPGLDRGPGHLHFGLPRYTRLRYISGSSWRGVKETG